MRPTPAPCLVLPAGLLLAAPALLAAQAPVTAPAAAAPAAVADVPATIDACYVPASGTLYRINTAASPAPGAPPACLAATHVKFTWSQQGPQGPAGPQGPKGDPGTPGSAASLGPDIDLAGSLKMGKTGTFGGGLLATSENALAAPSGAGTRLMWMPQKHALRAGRATGAEWDAASVGEYSVALGVTARASGSAAVALGAQNTATGANTVALGFATTASGDFSTALGRLASTNGKAGSFVYGDNSTAGSGALVQADAENQFVVRAAGGVKLRTAADLSKGCNVDGAGNLACTGTVTGTNTGGAAIGPDLVYGGRLEMGKTGSFGGGLLASGGTHTLPVPSGPGFRFMWAPQKAAFRAGQVSAAQWDEASIGPWSAAVGSDVVASGSASFAAGDRTVASGALAVALGQQSFATGMAALAVGMQNVASGAYSVALGRHASTEGQAGAFVYADASTDAAAQATTPNQFLVRAAGGVRLRTSSDLTNGCDVSGAGKMTCTGGVSMTSTIFWKIGDWETLGWGESATKRIGCPTGYVVIGGGVEQKDGLFITIKQSFPDFGTNDWVAEVDNSDSTSSKYRLRVVCMRS